MLRRPRWKKLYPSTLQLNRSNKLRICERLESRIVMDGDAIHGRFDTVPDFGAAPTVYSVASGDWLSPQIWSTGRLPRSGDVVAVSPGTTVVYNQQKSPALETVVVHNGGHLTFRDGMRTNLLATNLLVMPQGRLTIGAANNPIDATASVDIVLRDKAIDTEFDPAQFGTGVIVFGTIDVYGAQKTPFVRLAREARAGDLVVALESAPQGWRAGDEVVIPETRQFEYGPGGTNQQLRTEKATIASAIGNTVTLSAPLAWDHLGARNADGQIVALPHAANVTRNVTIQSQNPTGTRGHTMFLDRADVDVHFAAFENLGRTTNDPLDSVRFDSNGQPTHIGTNQIGRYPIHAHHLIGPTSRATTDAYQFSFVGNAISDSRKWPIAVHDAHYGLIKDNVVYAGTGFGIGTEDGSESYNTFEGNFVAAIRGTTGRGKEREGREGDGFWFAGPNNTVRGNVAADILKAGYNIYGGDNASAFPQVIPAFRGADKLISGQGITVPMASVAVLEFSDNEVYSALMGIETWYLGYDNYYHPYQGTPETVIDDFLAWHTHRNVFFGNQQNHLTFDGLRAYADPRYVHEHGFSKGIVLLQSKAVTIRNATIENFKQGIAIHGYLDELGSDRPLDEITPFLIEGGHLENFDNVIVGSPIIDQRNIPPRVVVMRNVDFALLRGTSLEGRTLGNGTVAVPRNIVMAMQTDRGNLIQKSVTYVYGYGPNRDQNLELFLNEQRADYVMPKSATVAETDHVPGIVAAPVAGLTNAQTWSLYGIAIAGQIAPASAYTLPEIFGWVAPLDREDEGEPRVPGDFNGDSLVNNLDLAILKSNLGRRTGATPEQGDLNGDGAVNASDVIAFAKIIYAQNTPKAAAAMVATLPDAPEEGDESSAALRARRGSRLSGASVDAALESLAAPRCIFPAISAETRRR